MKIHLLSGFLGSGKTTTIQSACAILAADHVPVGVIANDQGIQLVDGNYFRRLGIPSRQVVNGCFCCHYNELDNQIQSLIETNDPACIFAEAVGSCTDMVATVVKPLLQFRPQATVTISVLADARLLLMLLEGNKNLFEKSVDYIYFKQLEEAGLILVNKTDLLEIGQLEKLRDLLQDRYSHKLIHFQNTFDDNDVRQWLNLLNRYPATTALPSLDIDYDIYGAGEAMLAWLDQELAITSPGNRAGEAAIGLARQLFKKVKEQGYAIGHLKFLLDDRYKISYTASDEYTAEYTASDERAGSIDGSDSQDRASRAQPSSLDGQDSAPAPQPASSASLLINARVQVFPDILSQLVEEVIRETEEQYGCEIRTVSYSAFQPGYPRPTHRMGN